MAKAFDYRFVDLDQSLLVWEEHKKAWMGENPTLQQRCGWCKCEVPGTYYGRSVSYCLSCAKKVSQLEKIHRLIRVLQGKKLDEMEGMEKIECVWEMRRRGDQVVEIRP